MTSFTKDPTTIENHVGLCGLDFLEFCGPDPEYMHRIFTNMGFSRLKKHKTKNIDYYRQNDIHFLVNREKYGFASSFGKAHGLSVCASGFRVKDAKKAYEEAVKRGAKPFNPDKGDGVKDHDLLAVYGVGDCLIYFIDKWSEEENYYEDAFVPVENPDVVEDKGFLFIDHMTNNVYKGTRDVWSSFYKDIFGFFEIRYFDIKGQKTGLTSFALKSPCQTFSIPINEGTEEKSQIEEYLREYKGAGIQHIALASRDLLASLDKLKGSGIETLDIDQEYYDEVFNRVPNVTEDRQRIINHQVLIDGDEEGYLLQIFTKNLFGPIFFEMIQRKNHHSFGEGNFGALFRAIERDQERRGVL